MKSSYCTSLAFIRIPLAASPLEKGGQGGCPRVTTAWCAGSGTAVLHGIVASAQRTGYASLTPLPPLLKGGACP